ncbi:MAG: hypothetical protein Q9160_005071 [Pyrenula sp. 1 TL-2023]
MRKRRTATRPYINKTSKLEEKLNGIVELLQSTAQGAPPNFDAVSIESPSDVSNRPNRDYAASSMETSSAGFQGRMQARGSPGRPVPRDSAFTPTTSSASETSLDRVQPNLPPASELSLDDSELYLSIFRRDYAEHLPFIVIPPSCTAYQLRTERPILWACIMAVASNKSAQQVRLSEEVRTIFGREAERRICFDRPILHSLISLGLAVLQDLGFDKPPSKDPAFVLACDLKGVKKPSRLTRSPTMEERRALLGCFLMSTVSSYLKKGETLRWTAYLDECLRIIETEREFPSDALLVQLVRLRLLAEKAILVPSSSGAADVDSSARLPAVCYLKSLEAQLRHFKSNIPIESTHNEILLMEFYMTELCIHEVGLSPAPDTFTSQSHHRLECLPRCLVGVHRLLTFEHPEWDKGLVREQGLDPFVFLEDLENYFMRVKEAAHLDSGASGEPDVYSLLAFKLRAMRTAWEGVVAPDAPSQDTAPMMEMCDFEMSLLDDEWLNYMFGPGTNNVFNQSIGT